MNPLIPYVPTDWVNDSSPDIDADHLNHLEDGVEAATTGVNGALDEAKMAQADANSFKQLLDQHIANMSNPHNVTAAQVGVSSPGGGGGGGGVGIDIVARGARGDDAFDNTAVIQACLDEIRNAGGGTLFIPAGRTGGNTFRTRCLWVPSNCRIISEGALLKNIGWALDARYSSWDGDQIAAQGLFTVQPQTKYGFNALPQRISFEGLFMEVVSSRPDGILTYGFDIGGNYINIDRCHVYGDPKDDINIGERRGQNLNFIWITKSFLHHARRNNISIEGADIRYIWIQDCWIGYCSGVPTPVGGGQLDNSPGAGIDIEQPSGGPGNLSHIWIQNNWITNCAGPAVACAFHIQPSDSLENLVIEGNRISDNSGNPQGGAFGGIYLIGGRTQDDIRITNNHIDGTRSGAGIQGADGGGANWRHQTLIAHNRMHGNAGGNILIPAPVGSVIVDSNF